MFYLVLINKIEFQKFSVELLKLFNRIFRLNVLNMFNN